MFNWKHFGKLRSKSKTVSKSMLSIVLSLCLVAVMLPAGIGLLSVSADAWDGTTLEPYVGYGDAAYGTQDNPYKIENAAQLAFLSKAVAMNGAEFEIDNSGTKYKAAAKKSAALSWYWSYYFEIVDDIDLNNKAWTPIGSRTAGFSGSIEGNDHEIVGLNCTMTTDAGTGLVGAYNRGTIQNLHLEGSLNGPSHIGSFIGRMGANSNLVNCSFDGTVTATANNSYAGGLAGWVQGASVLNFENCWTSGSISGAASVGGLFGLSYTATTQVRMNNCYSTMTVTSTGTKAGGLMGGCVEDTIIQNCHFSGTVNTVYPIAQTTNAITLNNVFYKAGSYNGTAAGTLTGAVEYTTNLDFVTESLNALAQTNGWASWSADTTKGYPVFETAPKLTNVVVSSGLMTFDPLIRNYTLQISSESVTLTPTFAEGTTVTINDAAAVSGVASAPITLADGASTVATIVATCGSTSWTYTIAITRNASIWDGTTKLPFVGYGDASYGTIDNPYLISNAAQLAFLSATVYQSSEKVTINGIEYEQSLYRNKYFKLTADIDLNNKAWTPIGKDSDNGNHRFAGNIDGNGYAIRNLTASRTKDVGLIGYVNSAVIRNLTVYGTISGEECVGGIAAQAQNTTFDGCHFIGTINGGANGYFGGIVGRVRGSEALNIKNCSTAGTLVSNKNLAGGLIGTDGSATVTIANSYSTMNVSRTGNTANTSGIGGLVGTPSSSNTTITNSFFAGTVNNGCPISGGIASTTNFPTLSDVYFIETATTASSFGAGTTGATEKSVADFTNGTLTALLNSKVTGSNGYNPWIDGTNHPVFKPLSQLSGLTISDGKLTFDPAVYEYNVTVRNPIESVTLTPSAGDAYVITVNGTAVTSGTASATIALTVGETTTITVGVAPSSAPTAVTEYVISVKRQAPPPEGVWDGTYEKYAGGTGSAENPYIIANASQLAFFAAMVNGETVVIGDQTYTAPEASYGLAYNADYFVLTADIVLNDISDIDTWATEAPLNNWVPIGGKFGTSSRHFGGTLDCGGHTITGLYTKTDVEGRGAGLFGNISTATVRDLYVKDAYVEGADYVGGITGRLGDTSRLINCSFEGTIVSHGTYTGGIVGQILGSNISLSGCYAEGSITGTKSLGGLVGRMAAGAANSTASIEFSYSAMAVVTTSATANTVGGLVGSFGGAAGSKGSIVGSHFAGTVNKNAPIIGYVENNTFTAVVDNVYYLDTCCAAPAAALTEIGKSAQEFANGTVAELLNQSVVGTTNWKTDSTKGYPVIVTVLNPVLLTDLKISEGMIAFNPTTYHYTVVSPYKFTQISVIPTVASGVTVKVNGQATASDTLSAPLTLEVGVAKRFTIQVLSNGVTTVYAVDVIRNEQAPDGVWDGSYEAYDRSGNKGATIDNPICINNEAQLAYLAAKVNGQTVMINGEAHSPAEVKSGVVYRDIFFKLTADLNMNSLENYANWATEAPNNEWVPIGFCDDSDKYARKFAGVFDGDSHTISGIYIDDTSRSIEGTGLFGGTQDATIRNVHVRDSYIKASQRIGGIVGRSRGWLTIQNCSFVGTVESNITTAAHHSYVAGIIGDSNGKTRVQGCWSDGTLIGSMGTAGLIGGMYMSGECYLFNSYSTATIVTPADCTKIGGLVGGLSATGALNIRRCHFAGSIPTSTPIVGYATTGHSISATNTYYMTGSFAAGTVDGTWAGEAEEKSVQEFADGTVTQLLNDAWAYGDFWNWKDGENGYPVSDGVLLVTDYKDYTDDSEFNDLHWADKFVNADGGILNGGNANNSGSNNGGSNNNWSDTGEGMISVLAIVLLLISAAAIVFLSKKKRQAQ